MDDAWCGECGAEMDAADAESLNGMIGRFSAILYLYPRVVWSVELERPSVATARD